MYQIFWSIICLVLMLCMVGVELLTPTMGGFVLAAMLCSVLSVYSAYGHSATLFYIMLVANLTLFPLAILVGYKFLSSSPIINQTQNAEGIQSAPDSQPLLQLKGEIGKALTPLRPGGSAMINDKKFDVVTEGKFVNIGTVVKVIRVNGATVIVEPID